MAVFFNHKFDVADVDKYQDESELSKFMLENNAINASLRDKAFQAVSYTHLDVYKRQH